MPQSTVVVLARGNLPPSREPIHTSLCRGNGGLERSALATDRVSRSRPKTAFRQSEQETPHGLSRFGANQPLATFTAGCSEGPENPCRHWVVPGLLLLLALSARPRAPIDGLLLFLSGREAAPHTDQHGARREVEQMAQLRSPIWRRRAPKNRRAHTAGPLRVGCPASRECPGVNVVEDGGTDSRSEW
jgi:hypothetical protein